LKPLTSGTKARTSLLRVPLFLVAPADAAKKQGLERKEPVSGESMALDARSSITARRHAGEQTLVVRYRRQNELLSVAYDAGGAYQKTKAIALD